MWNKQKGNGMQCLKTLQKQRPKFHGRSDAGSKDYSLSDNVLKWISKYLQPGSNTLETGCGYSTVLFAALCKHHTIISPFPQEVNLIKEWSQSINIPFDNITFIASESQKVIHSIQDQSPLDMVLIDGDHAFPAPFIDWYYTADRIKKGGFVIVDDTQLITGKILQDFLNQEKTRWELSEKIGKTSIFKKMTEGKVAEGIFWTHQPYVSSQSRTGEMKTKKPFLQFPTLNKTHHIIDPDNFNDFFISKKSHFELFSRNEYDIKLFGSSIEPSNASLKNYQDLLTFALIHEKIPPGSKILEIGGGSSRIINHYKTLHECWNIDKLEGLGHGPVEVETNGFKLVQDYMGNFSRELPDEYFDLVFSISVLEHIPREDPVFHSNILKDMDRVLKRGGYSLHCIDCIFNHKKAGANPMVNHMFENHITKNHKITFEEIICDKDIFILPEEIYMKNWFPHTKKSRIEHGKPISINILWKKK